MLVNFGSSRELHAYIWLGFLSAPLLIRENVSVTNQGMKKFELLVVLLDWEKIYIAQNIIMWHWSILANNKENDEKLTIAFSHIWDPVARKFHNTFYTSFSSMKILLRSKTMNWSDCCHIQCHYVSIAPISKTLYYSDVWGIINQVCNYIETNSQLKRHFSST